MKSAHKVNKSEKKELVVYIVSGLAIIVLLSLSIININKFLTKQRVLGAEVTTDTASIESEKVFWEKVVKENPTYRDGYLELAIIQSTLGNKVESLKNFEKAKTIDPNSSKITEVQKLLNLGN
ncbi:MAG TPA: hypothetical protein VF185_00855 [Patescibacteria group bacterium]